MVRVNRPASRFQRHDDPTRRIAAKARPKIKRAIADALHRFRRSIATKTVADLIRRRDYRRAADAVDVATLQENLREAFHTIAAAYHEAGRYGAAQVSEDLRAAAKRRVRKNRASSPPDRFAFDLFAEDVLEDLRDQQGVLITELTNDARQTIYDRIIAGVRAGDDPSDVAASIRNVIGLTSQQAQYVENYRQALQAGRAGEALDNELRDRSLDDAVSAGTVDIDEAVNRYAENWIDFRAETIAQTEASRAANAGLQDAYAQAIDRGVMPDDAVRQYWVIAEEDREEDECDDLADYSADGLPIGESFVCDDGEFDSPPAHPRCKCSIEIRTNLDMIAAPDAGGGEDEGEDEAA